MKTVVLVGKGELACRILDWFNQNGRYSIIGVVPVIPEPTWSKSLKNHAIRSNNSILEWVSGDFGINGYKIKSNFSADLLVSVFFDKILKKKPLSRFNKNINIHNAPLPRYRGMNPINHALRHEQRFHGVTIHEMDEGIDTGRIYSQIIFPINPVKDEVKDIYEKCLDFGYKLFEATIPYIFTDEPFYQNHLTRRDPSYYPLEAKNILGDRSSWVR